MFEKQYLVILSLMCLAFSQLQALNTKSDKLAELLEQGRHHLESACSLTSWNEPCLKSCWRSLACAGSDAINVSSEQLRLMMQGTWDLLARRQGSWTNDGYIAEAVDRRCFGGHDHIQLLNGSAKACESIFHDWWRRYCAICDRASAPRDAARCKG